MATKAKMVESRSHLRPSLVRSQARSMGLTMGTLGAPGARRSRSNSQMTKLESAIPKLESPPLLKPSVQPSSSPPVKEIISPAEKRKMVPLVKPSSLMDRIPSYSAAPPSPVSAAPASISVGLPSMPVTETSVKSATRTFSQPILSSNTTRKVVLSSIPGFFGLMGLGQFYEGKRSKGLAFLIAGITVSFLSSWYIVLPSRIDSLFFGGSIPSAYALSILAPIFGSSAIASRFSLDLLGVVMVLWGLQFLDAMGPIFTNKESTALSQGLRVTKIDVGKPVIIATSASNAKEIGR